MYILKSTKVVTFNLKLLLAQQRIAAGLRSAAKKNKSKVMYILKSIKVITFNLKLLSKEWLLVCAVQQKKCAQASDYDGSSEHLRFPN